MSLLQIDNLQVGIAGLSILHDISMELTAGSIVTVLGANGAGKTTLLRTLSGIYRATSGTIRFDGQEINGLPSHRIAALHLAHAPEGRQIFSGMTVKENLILGALNSKHVAADFDAMYQLFPILKTKQGKPAGTLSGGEQQMLCVARALMSRPKLLLLDEPSLGLAPLMVRQIFDLIKTIRDQGVSVLLVEQNVRAALAVADFAYVLEGGRIVLSGEARHLAEDHRVKNAYLGGASKQGKTAQTDAPAVH